VWKKSQLYSTLVTPTLVLLLWFPLDTVYTVAVYYSQQSAPGEKAYILFVVPHISDDLEPDDLFIS
jgi:hypothetical protein